MAATVARLPRAIPLAMITVRISIHGFSSLSYMGIGLHLAVLRAAGALLKTAYKNLSQNRINKNYKLQLKTTQP